MKAPGFLVVFHADGRIHTTDFDHEPTLDEIKAVMGTPDVYLEHHMIQYSGQRAHLFIDEDGRSKRLPFNRLLSGAVALENFFPSVLGTGAIYTGHLS